MQKILPYINRPDTAKPYDFSSTFIANNEEKPLNITYEAEGYATFAIPYKIQTKEEGAIKISVSVLDACANPSQVQELTIIKSTGIDISNLDPYNYKLGLNKNAVYDDKRNIVFDAYPEYNSEEHKKMVKTIHIKRSDIKKIIYKDLENDSLIPDISVKYKNTSGTQVTEQLVYNAENEEYSIELNVSSTENLQFQIAVGENGTYTDSRSFLFPGKVYIFNISGSSDSKTIEVYNTGTADKYFYFCDFHSVYKCRGFTNGKIVTQDPAAIYSFFAKNGSLLGEYSARTYSSSDSETPKYKANDLVFSDVQISPRPNTNTNTSIDINCYISDELWEKYDAIFIEYKATGYPYDQRKYFEKDSNMLSFPESFDNLYSKDEIIHLYGIGENDKYYDGCSFILPNISSLSNPAQYDTISPTAVAFLNDAKFYYTYLKENGFKIFYAFYDIKDSVSGIKTIEYWAEANPTVKSIGIDKIIGEKKFDNYEGGGATYSNVLTLPLTDTKEDEVTYYLRVTDNNNNIKNVQVSLPLPETYFEIKDFVKGTTPKVSWYISYLSDKTTFTNKVESFLYVYDDSDWSLDPEVGGKTNIETPSKVEGKTYELSTETTLPKNAWVKLRVATYENVSYYKCNSLSAEKILYTGTSSTENYANTGSDAVLFYSDQPLFLRILATEYPYETCKNWSRELWEKRPIVVTEKSLPAGTVGKLASYNFKQDYSNIPDGGSFVTIVYFADGSVKMSDVRQK